MKVCFKCDINKPLDMFYKHEKMADGRLNKCKDCTKKDSSRRHHNLNKDVDWVKKERLRNRDKYHRLNYKEKISKKNNTYPWRKSYKLKNLCRKFVKKEGYELHHWSYKDENLEDVIMIDVKSHRQLHTLITLDLENRHYTSLDGKTILDTKKKHLDYISYLQYEYQEPIKK